METVDYKLENGSLYRNSVKICDKVKKMTVTEGSNEKELTIYFEINNYEKTTTYVLEPEPEKTTNVEI